RYRANAGQQLALVDVVVLERYRADLERYVRVLHRLLHLVDKQGPLGHDELESLGVHHDFHLSLRTRGPDFLEPPQDCLLIEAVPAGQIEYDAVRLALRLYQPKAQHRDHSDEEKAFHGSSSGWPYVATSPKGRQVL